MNSTTAFVPEWASPPGETITDVLNARGWSHVELAAQLDKSPDMVEALLKGEVAITIGVARRLQDVIGASVAFWMARDFQYRQDLERVRQLQRDWRDSLPLADMTRFGWIPERLRHDIDSLLTFFGVSSVSAWRARYAAALEAAAFKTSPTFESHPPAVVAWLRQAELVAAELECAPWRAETLRETLIAMRGLTRIRQPERFLPKMRAAMAHCGVAVAVLPAPEGCRASGATWWLSGDKALLLLSARYLSDDHFWFTFYHECGHLLLHRDADLIIEGEAAILAAQPSAPDANPSTLDTREDEANAFAEDVLITPAVQEALRRVPLNTHSVLRLAVQAGISPGILVGQLQRIARIGPNRLNGLKRRYLWADGELVSR